MSKILPLVASILLLFSFSVLAEDIVDQLQQISVTVKATDSQGSGIIITRNGISYVLTAGHVVEGNRTGRYILDRGTQKQKIEFLDLKIITHIYEGDRDIETRSDDAEVLAYSGPDYGYDTALLRIRKKDFTKNSTRFYSEKKAPDIGSNLYHVGSLLGDFGNGSVTTGILSRVGRMVDNKVYDQTSCLILPGSSGGGVFLTDGRYIGMAVMAVNKNSNMNFIVPIRRLVEWSKHQKVDFIFDSSLPVTADKDIILESDEAPIQDNPLSIILGSGQNKLPK